MKPHYFPLSLGSFAWIALWVISPSALASVRVTLPAELGKTIAQGALGQPLPSGDSRVTLLPKPDLSARAHARMKRIPPVLLAESSRLFGLKLDAPFDLDLRFFGMKTDGDVRVSSLRFEEGSRRGDASVNVSVELELRNIRVTAREAWVRELGLTSEVASTNEEKACETRKDPMDAFARGRLAARVRKPTIIRKSARDGAHPIRVQAKFRVSNPVSSQSSLGLSLLEVSHDVEQVIEKHYRLDADLEVPPVFIRIAGECYPGDSSGVLALFEELKEPLKVLIAGNLHEELIQIAMRESMKAFASIQIPVAKEWKIEKEAPWAGMMTQGLEALPDATRVSRPLQPLLVEDASPVTENPGLLDSLVWSFHERVALAGLEPGRRGALHLRFEDRTEINAREAPRLAPRSGRDGFESSAREQDPKHLRVEFDRSFFDSKLDLLSMLRWEQSLVFPHGMRLGEKGFSSRPAQDGSLGLVLPVEIVLAKLPGLMGVGADLLERFAGNTGGVLRLPLHLSIRLDLDPERFVVLSAVLERDSESESNLDRANALIQREVLKQVEEFGQKVEDLRVRIPLKELDRSPLRLEHVFFSESGALSADFSLSPIRSLLQKKKHSLDSKERQGVERRGAGR
jgi:hypothetical protein